MKKFKVECHKCLYIPMVIFSCALVFLSCIISTCYMGADQMNYSALELIMSDEYKTLQTNIQANWLTIWMNSIGVWAQLLFPALVSVNYIVVVTEERKNGVVRQLLLRENIGSYCITKVMGSAVSAGITLGFGYMLYGVFCYGAFPSLSDYPVAELKDSIPFYYAGGEGFFICKYLLKVMLYGVFVNILPVAFSIFFSDMYILLCVPLMIQYGWTRILLKMQIKAMEYDNQQGVRILDSISPRNFLAVQWDKTQLFTLLLLLLGYICLMGLFYVRIKTGREKDGVA